MYPAAICPHHQGARGHREVALLIGRRSAQAQNTLTSCPEWKIVSFFDTKPERGRMQMSLPDGVDHVRTGPSIWQPAVGVGGGMGGRPEVGFS